MDCRPYVSSAIVSYYLKSRQYGVIRETVGGRRELGREREKWTEGEREKEREREREREGKRGGNVDLDHVYKETR